MGLGLENTSTSILLKIYKVWLVKLRPKNPLISWLNFPHDGEKSEDKFDPVHIHIFYIKIYTQTNFFINSVD